MRWRRPFNVRLLIIATFIVLGGAILLAAFPPWGTTVHRIPIPGHPGKTVDFIRCRAMNGEYGYIARFGGSETKRPIIPSSVSMAELKATTRIEYRNNTLTVLGPHGMLLEVGGFRP